jgi:hypothetical protein
VPSYLLKTGSIFFSTSTNGDYTVRFYDYDGTLLKSQSVIAGSNAEAPALPSHDGLTFSSWNNTFTNVQHDIDVGAIYSTADGKTHAHVRITTVTGLSTTLFLNKSDGSTLSVDWGDGSEIATYTNTGNFNTGAHTYAANGDYIIKLWISNGSGTYGLGNGTTSTCFCGGSIQASREQLVSIFIGSGVTSIGTYAFYQCSALASVVMPNSVTSIGASAFFRCYALASVVIPNSVTSIGASAFYRCSALASVVIPNSVTSIGTSAFYQCYALSVYQFSSTTPPTLSATVFASIIANSKIYVPDASVAAYKNATNWITWADYIYPISEMP